MRTRLPPNVHREKTRHGTVVYYYRIGKGPRTRLPDYGTPEFEPAYQAALAGEPAPKVRGAREIRQGTLSWLIGEYKQTLHFRGLDEITKRRRDSFFRQIAETAGDQPLARITEAHILDGVERRTGGKGHAANNYLKAIKPMFAYAKKRLWIAVDPARNVDYVDPVKGSRLAWTIENVRDFEDRHPLGTMAHLAVRILLFTGLRRSDAVLLGRQHIRNGVVNFTPGKTEGSSGVTVTFTALPPLIEAIEATGSGDMTLLRTELGTPFASGASFGNWFRDRCVEAGIEARAHGLRKLGPTIAAEYGATSQELMAMWGWSTLAQAELYTRSADRKRLGDSAAAKLMTGYVGEKANATPRTLKTGAGMPQKEQ